MPNKRKPFEFTKITEVTEPDNDKVLQQIQVQVKIERKNKQKMADEPYIQEKTLNTLEELAAIENENYKMPLLNPPNRTIQA